MRDDGLSQVAASKPVFTAEASETPPQALLLQEEDCGPLPHGWELVPAIRYHVTVRPQHRLSSLVERWMNDSCADLDARIGLVTQADCSNEVIEWCRSNGVTEIWSFRPLRGFVEAALSTLAVQLANDGVELRYADRRHDLRLFPLATRGFFPFWEAASHRLRREWKSGKCDDQ